MFKKILTLLFISFWCFSLVAQDAVEISPNSDPVNQDPALEAIWDVLLQFDASALSGASGNAGAEWDGTYFYSTRWAANLIHEYSADGTTLIREFSVSGVTGLRDLAWDGQYMYGGAAANTIYQMDFATNTLIGTIPSPVAVRYIAYDAANDGFWVGNWSDPPTLIDRSGNIIATATSGVTSQYGAAYDDVSPGGPFLWIFDQGTGGGTPQLIHQIDIATGTPTGVTHDVLTTLTGAGGTASIAGGLFSMTDFASGFFTIGGLLQGNPIGDQIFVYEIEPVGVTPTLFYDDFEAYVAGQQLACQNPVDWTTWSNLPCDPVEDAFISSTYSQSGDNSVVFVQNNDVVKPLGDVTSGKHEIRMSIYIPDGKSGYFNTLSGFTPAPFEWGMECYFDVGGGGRVFGGSSTAINFSYAYDTWHLVSVVVDLDTDNAEFWFNGVMVHSWQWTLGANGGGSALNLAASDFFGATVNDEMYMDDYYFGEYPVPVELTSFSANVNNNGSVTLDWETATELNNLMFEIERKDENSEFRTIGYVDGAGTTTEPQQYSYTDVTVGTGVYTYRLKNVDFDGRYYFSDPVEVDVKGPLSFALQQNYPNPFNPSTNIKFSVPEAGDIKLAVYNIVGEQVAVLVDGFTEAGFYNVTFDATSLPSGVYLYKLQSANSVETKKMMLLK